ncbi:tyrosine--tRNA ligase [Sphingobacterium sp.]|uniref:tyrosine--tRNA ligase n=1 Tax=Sphingobacterium sp. TaxID=341027 RepID=UPI002898D167|nr:tyrosine--tRNA ligase [Sphingobacterium sp.]
MLKELEENIEIILPQEGLALKLKESTDLGRALIIKLGFDPTAPDLHLGHAVVLKKLRQFQQLGHQIVVLVGNFTARIGDPTGKNKARKPLGADEIAANAATYIAQLSKIIDVSKAKVLFNADWLDQLNFAEVIQLASKITVAQLMQRHDFHKRFSENQPIAMHELLYPILQGFDSVHVQSDIEMGGTDQMFNCTMGRQIQESYGLDPQIVLCMPLLRGLDGKEKMSKSLNNTIGILDEPNEMFGKTMSIPDHLIPEYIDLTTDFNTATKLGMKARIARGENPMEIKKLIAQNLVAQYHSVESAHAALDFFVKRFQYREFEAKAFEEISRQSLHDRFGDKVKLVDLCYFLKGTTKSAMRRLIYGGGVQIDSTKQTDPEIFIDLNHCFKIKLGKRSYFNLI